ncbi:hypothetical protein VNI00_016785 [Paramarasmius palmivorus]|uniref:mannan endo-1,6-alpha-mannosidase n=1 Tax=Paramarasmius palmivorus TaxID=297713 RepID=A0AAW0BDV5_9AGAR
MFSLWALVPLFLSFLLSVSGQTFSSSPSWRKPDITSSIDQRIQVAGAALDRIANTLDSQGRLDASGVYYGTAGALYGQMAEFDRLTNQRKYQAQLRQYFLNAKSGFRSSSGFLTTFCESPAHFVLGVLVLTLLDSLYGYSAVLAYNAYQDTSFLEYAEDAWTLGRSYTLSSSDINTGKNSNKDFTLSKQCRNQPMVGGSFWSMDSKQGDIVGLASGSFLVLSASLAKATPNPIYSTAASESVQFIRAQLVNSDNVVLDSISADANKSCVTSSGNVFPYNSGWLLQGLAILKNTTDGDMEQFHDWVRYRNVLSGSVTSKAWQGDDGIIGVMIGGQPNGDPAMVQALLEIYRRADTPSDQRKFVRDYLGVQYNAVLDQATVPGSNVYGLSWNGPPGRTFDANAQYNALSILIGGISLADGTPSSTANGSPLATTTTTTTSDNASASGSEKSEESKSKSNTAAIIGGAVGGGLVLILGAVFGVLFYRRRRRTRSDFDTLEDQVGVLVHEMSYAPSPPSSSGSPRPSRHPSASASLGRGVGVITLVNRPSTSASASTVVSDSKSAIRLDAPTPAPAEHPNAPTLGAAGGSNSDMSTAQLVHLLHQRLNPMDDTPPEYHSTY